MKNVMLAFCANFAKLPETDRSPRNHRSAVLADLDLQPIDDTTVRRRVLDRLKEHIVAGGFPPNHRLTEQSLAAALKVSRGPLREAIRELIELGLIVSVPYKGMFVRAVTREDLEELYSLRTTLERFAFERCWKRRTSASLADLVSRSEALKKTIDDGADPDLAIDQELSLHSWCYELSGHKLLIKSWESMKPNLKFYFSLHQRAHGRKGPLRQSHDVYVELACGDDLAAMLDHLQDHMRQGLETTMSALPAEDDNAA